MHRVALLPRDRDAHLPGDLAGILDRPLVALPLSVGMALGTSGVTMVTTISSGSLPLANMSNNTTMSTMDNVRVMSNNTRAVVNLLGDLVTLLSHNILALFHIGGVHNGVMFGVAGLLMDSVADLIMLGVANLVMFSVAGSVCGRVIHSLAPSLSTVTLATMVSNSTTSRGQGSSGEEEGEVPNCV